MAGKISGCEIITDAGGTVAWSVVLAQVEGLSFERGAISLRRETLA